MLLFSILLISNISNSQECIKWMTYAEDDPCYIEVQDYIEDELGMLDQKPELIEDFKPSEPYKITPYNFDLDCTEYWNDEDWDSVFVEDINDRFVDNLSLSAKEFLSGKKYGRKFYYPDLYDSLASTNLWNWNDPSKQDVLMIFGSDHEDIADSLINSDVYVASANDAYAKAMVYHDMVHKKRFYNESVNGLTDDPLVQLAVITNPITNLYDTGKRGLDSITWFVNDNPESLMFAEYYRQTMDNEIKALEIMIEKNNVIYSDADSISQELIHMGANSDEYKGYAKKPLEEYLSFVSDVSNNIDIDGQPPTDADEASNYAIAYRGIENLNQVCHLTSIHPQYKPMYDFEPIDLSYNLLTSLEDEDSVLMAGLNFRHRLNRSKEIILDELGTAKKDAQKSADTQQSYLKYLEEADLNQFYTSFEQEDDHISSATKTVGTLEERYEKMQIDHSIAKTHLQNATDLEDEKESGWAAYAIIEYKKANQSYTKALENSISINNSIHDSYNLAKLDAQDKIEELELLNSKGLLGDATVSASCIKHLQSARLDRQDAVAADSLGEGYSHYLNASKKAQQGIDCINGDSIVSDTDKINRLLEEFKDYLDTAENLDADVEVFRSSYDFFKQNFDMGSDTEYDVIKSELDNLKNHLSTYLGFENTLYQKIIKNKIKDKDYLLELRDFESKFKEDSSWSLYAYENPSKLRKDLEDLYESTLSKILEKIKDSMCKNSRFIQNNFAYQNNAESDIGGTFRAVNKEPYSYQDGFELICDLKDDHEFKQDDLSEKSDNILSAYSKSKKMHLTLDSIDANQLIYANFSKTAIPISIEQKKCSLFIDENKQITYRSTYDIDINSPVQDVILDVNWSRVGDVGHAKAHAHNGKRFTGDFKVDSNDGPIARFILLDYNKDLSPIDVELKPVQKADIQILDKKYTSLDSQDEIGVSYTMVLKNLLECSELKMDIYERSASMPKSLKAYSNTSRLTVQSSKNRLSQGFIWTLTLRPSKESVEIKVSYKIKDSSLWFEQTTESLKRKADGYDDKKSIDMLIDAGKSYANGDIQEAYKLLSDADKRLESLSETDEDLKPHYSALFDSLKNKSTLLRSLKSKADPIDTSKNSPWHRSVDKWVDDLDKALSESTEEAEGGDYTKAISILQKEDARLERSTKTSAQKDYLLLETAKAELDNLYDSLLIHDQDTKILGTHLDSAKQHLRSQNNTYSLSSLFLARTEVLGLYSSALNISSQKISEQNRQITEIIDDSRSLSWDYTRYLDMLEKYDSFGVHAAQPSLSKKEAIRIQKDLDKIGSSHKNKSSNDLSKIPLIYQENKEELEQIQEYYSSALSQLQKGYESMKDSAYNLKLIAELKISKLEELKPDSKLIDDLESELIEISDLYDSKEYGEAIIGLESIIVRATKATPEEKEISDDILLIAGASLLLVLSIAYILTRSNKEELDPPEKQTKKLEKSD